MATGEAIATRELLACLNVLCASLFYLQGSRWLRGPPCLSGALLATPVQAPSMLQLYQASI